MSKVKPILYMFGKGGGALVFYITNIYIFSWCYFVGLEEKALREMPTEMEMGRLASHLGKDNFITTAAELCIDLPTRQQIEADHPDSITKRMFYALHTWRRCSSEDRPDFRTLREMLLNLNMDEHILCKVEYSDTFENYT